MPRTHHRTPWAGSPATPTCAAPHHEHALRAAVAEDAPPTPPPGVPAPTPIAQDDWLRHAMAHWLEDDAPKAFARMGDGH